MDRDDEIVLEGHELSDLDATILEANLGANPSDVDSRLRLIGYLQGRTIRDPEFRVRFAGHVAWFLDHMPGRPIVGTGWFLLPLPDPAFDGIRQAWDRLVGRSDAAPEVLFNAAKFFSLSDPKRSRELLERGEALAPLKPEWAQSLGEDLFREVHVARDIENMGHPPPLKPDEIQAIFARALGHFERALGRISSLNLRFEVSVHCAQAALEAGQPSKALAYADEAIAMAKQCKDEPHRRDFLHWAHVVRGCVALDSGQVESACRELQAAGSQGEEIAPVLYSFGPDFRLARLLLERGETKAVVAYLDRCSTFWEPKRISKWRSEIKQGRRPLMFTGYDPNEGH